MKSIGAIALVPLVILLMAFQTSETAESGKTAAPETGARLLRTDSRAPYVHRLTLYDHEGKAIDPADENPRPYSPKMTCGKCHAYGEIDCGWHFNSGSADLAGFGIKKSAGAASQPSPQHGRPGEPWIYADARLGVQIPISTRGWPGTLTPAQVGLSNWQFTLLFGRHLAGGGLSEPDEKTIAASAEAKRWAISGTLEIDCMVCHANVASGYDAGEIERQVERQNFRWSPTAALGLGIIRGDARGVSNDFDPESAGTIDRPDLTLPKVQYDKTRFDGDNRVHFDIVRAPPNERCFQCHSTRYVGAGAPQPWQRQPDVHLAAGLSCTDCHRHGIDHQVTRGDTPVAAESCAGCHLGTDPTHAAGGGYPAPRPRHAGIPPLHFEKLTCTACHSGPWPGEWAKTVQTSLAHGLGVSTKERRSDAAPQLIEPVFARDELRHIAPFRMMWPAFWGKRDANGAIEPLAPELVSKAAGRALPRVKGQSFEQARALLTDEQIDTVLKALTGKVGENAAPVYVRDGRVFQSGGKSDAVDPTSRHMGFTGPLLWPLAHDVRPAAQSLGVRGCADCHASDSPVYFGRAAAAPPAASQPAPAMHVMHGSNPRLASAWALTFAGRGMFKWFGWTLVALTTLLLIRPPAFRVTKVAESEIKRTSGWERLASGLLLIGVLAQAATSFGVKWLGGSVSGWTLLIHVCLSPILLLGLFLSAWLLASHCRFGVETSARFSATQKLLHWLVMPLGVVVAATMLTAMLPIFGPESQRWLIEVHEIAGLLLLIASILHLVASFRSKRSA